MKTICRQANQLEASDIIVALDGSRHVVQSVVVRGLSAAWLTFYTDTGTAIEKSQTDAKLHTYDVVCAG